MKNTLVFLALILAGIFGVQAQVSVLDNLSIEVLKAKGVSRNFNVRSLNTSNTKELTKVLTRCQIESLDEGPVDVNAFSLLDTRNKIRYKMGDFKAYRAVGGQSKMMLNEEILNEKGKPYGDLPDYDPSHMTTLLTAIPIWPYLSTLAQEEVTFPKRKNQEFFTCIMIM
ncbi:hypothetical protein [Allomuricauda sp. M10]|uniref:hypothetical protein n=1 Tax=Allomuricauda sp. M10 TaxID=2683292 RepID=UPI001D1826DC|nr:hypothetical protein [Muricauda sp. M10]